VLVDFKRVLARVQHDFDFYIKCRTNGAVALADYDLTPDERSALGDPDKLSNVLSGGMGLNRLPSITIKISGSHDWVNRTQARQRAVADPSHDAKVATEVATIREAGSDEQRTDAVLRLMELIG